MEAGEVRERPSECRSRSTSRLLDDKFDLVLAHTKLDVVRLVDPGMG